MADESPRPALPVPDPPAEPPVASRFGPWGARVAIAALYLAAVAVLLGPSLAGSHVALPNDILTSQLPWSETAVGTEAPRNHELRDTIDQYFPLQSEVVSRLRAGQDPTWFENAGFGLPGLPFVGWGGASPFNFLPGLVLPWEIAWSWGQGLRLLTAMVGAHLLTRAWGVGRAGATVAGLAFGLSGFIVGWLGWPQSHVGAWLPWLAWATTLTVRRTRWWAPAALAVFTAFLWLGGFPAVAVYSLLAAGVIAVHGAVSPWRGAAWACGRLAVALAGVAVGTLLVGATLIPSLGILAEFDLSARADAWSHKVFASQLWTFLIPGIFGDHVTYPRWLGSAYVETVAYAGVSTLLLALPAWVVAPRLRGVALWTGLGIGFGLFAYGFPPLQQLVRMTPLLSTNSPSRGLVVVSLSIAVLGAMGVDAVVRAVDRSEHAQGRATLDRRAVLVAAGVLTAIGIVVLSVGSIGHLQHMLSDRLAEPAERAAAVAAGVEQGLIAAAFVAAVAAVIVGGWSVGRKVGPAGARLAGLGLVVVVAADMLFFAYGWNTQVPREDVLPDAPGIAEAEASPHRVTGADNVGLPSTNLRYDGWADIRLRGFLTEDQRRVLAEEMEAVFISPTNWTFGTGSADSWEPWMGRLAVDTVLVPSGAAAPSGWSRESLGPVDAVEVANTQPGIHVVGDTTEVDIAPWRDEPLPALPEAGDASVEALTRDGGRIQARVTSDDGAILVVRDAALHGWHAHAEGQPLPLVTADELFFGVVVPPGTHDVQVRYRAPGQTVGWLVTGTGGAGLLALGLGGLLTRRSPVPNGPKPPVGVEGETR